MLRKTNNKVQKGKSDHNINNKHAFLGHREGEDSKGQSTSTTQVIGLVGN